MTSNLRGELGILRIFWDHSLITNTDQISLGFFQGKASLLFELIRDIKKLLFNDISRRVFYSLKHNEHISEMDRSFEKKTRTKRGTPALLLLALELFMIVLESPIIN